MSHFNSFIHICLAAALVSQVQGQAETTALWLFDEPVGCYAQVGFLDERGQPFPGYSVQDCLCTPVPTGFELKCGNKSFGRFGQQVIVRTSP